MIFMLFFQHRVGNPVLGGRKPAWAKDGRGWDGQSGGAHPQSCMTIPYRKNPYPEGVAYYRASRIPFWSVLWGFSALPCLWFSKDFLPCSQPWPRVKKNVAPLPTSPLARTFPPCRLIILATVASPTPVPENSFSE